MNNEKIKKLKLITFERSPAKMGDDYIFWIPRLYIKNNLIDPNKKYKIYIEELDEKQTND